MHEKKEETLKRAGRERTERGGRQAIKSVEEPHKSSVGEINFKKEKWSK